MQFLLITLVVAIFTSSTLSQNTADPVCQPGTFKIAKDCLPCPRLKFSTTTNARFCRRCPPSQEGNPEKTSCVPIRCPLGWYLPPGKVNCRVCPENSYSTTTDATECTPCPPDTKSLRGATAPSGCIKCPIGRFVSRSYRDRTIRCSTCTRFRSTFTVSADVCVDCIPGTFRNRRNFNDGRCFPCHPGRHAPHSGTKHCTKCPPGTYQPAQGATTCLPCPSGSVPDNTGRHCQSTCTSGSPGCVKCAAGQTLNSETTSCERCPLGSISIKGTVTECIPCRGGSVANAAQSRCLCDLGFFYREADESCQECPPGFSNTDGVKCSCVLQGRSSLRCFCPPLKKNVNNVCVPCTPTFSNRRTCSRCEENERIDEVQGTCVSCPDDTFSIGTGAKTCEPCPADTKRSGFQRDCRCEERNQGIIDGKCTQCPPGQFVAFSLVTNMPICTSS